MKPLVSGMPASANSRNANVAGDERAALARGPAHCARWVASPLLSRTSVTTAKAAMVVKP